MKILHLAELINLSFKDKNINRELLVSFIKEKYKNHLFFVDFNVENIEDKAETERIFLGYIDSETTMIYWDDINSDKLKEPILFGIFNLSIQLINCLIVSEGYQELSDYLNKYFNLRAFL